MAMSVMLSPNVLDGAVNHQKNAAPQKAGYQADETADHRKSNLVATVASRHSGD